MTDSPSPRSSRDFDRLRSLFEQARQLPAAERAAFVQRIHAEQPALGEQLEALLPHAEAPSDRLRQRVAAPDTEPDEPPDDEPEPAFDEQVQPTPTDELLRKLATAPRLDERRFAFERRIGSGGMGAVHRVHDQHLNRRLAIKFVLDKHKSDHPADQSHTNEVLGRFLEEAQVTSQLDHPGVIPVHELGLDQHGDVFFMMRMVQGRTASEVFADAHAARDGWTLTRALEVVLKVCDTMSYAHQKGVLHRDLKPINVMVGRFGEVYVMDWGLAKVTGQVDRHDERLRAAATGSAVTPVEDAEAPGAAGRTRQGSSLGTPSYMSSEQARGEFATLDVRTDVYAVGAMLYELLTGLAPYTSPGENVGGRALRERVLAGPPASIESLQAGVPAELVAIVGKAMARDREQRYADTAALAGDVRAFLGSQVVSAYRTGALVELQLWVRRNKPLAASLAAALLILVAGIVVSTTLANKNATLAAAEKKAKGEAAQQANDVLSLSAQKDHDDLVAEAAELWPAHPEMIPRYADWLRRANELINGRPADEAKGMKKRPSLAEHKATLAELRRDAKPLTEAQICAERESHPKYAELKTKQAELLWQSRMHGLEAWPSEAEVEAALAVEALPTDADGLNKLARPLVHPAKPVYGQEVRALLLAQRAVAAASAEERSGIRKTMAWALHRVGRFDEALSEERTALSEPGGDALESSAADLEKAVGAWRGDELAKRREEREKLVDEVSALTAEVDKRRTYEFDDPEKEWWNRQLAKLVSDLESLRHPATGLMNDVLAEPFGWGVAKRYEFAKSIGKRSIDGPEAKRLWAEAIAAIKASPKYGNLAIEPQMGLLPMGLDPNSQLWEFAHLQTGEPAVRDADGKLVLTEETGLVLVLIPGGKFWMGAQNKPGAQNHDPQAQGDESPVHEVDLSPYFLSKYEMTQGQWQRIAAVNPSAYGPWRFSKSWNREGNGWSSLHPVEQVSWLKCVGLMGNLDLSLPSEAQWECGTRGGTASVYWSGNDLAALAGVANLNDAYGKSHGNESWRRWENDHDDGNTAHARVGAFRANPFGLHDVHGNVWEWCQDGYDDSGFYGTRSGTDPVSPWSGASFRVRRGGSFSLVGSSARSAVRHYNTPEYRGFDHGLRPSRALRLSPSPRHPPK